MCCVPRATCPALEATRIPPCGAVGWPGLSEQGSQHIPLPCRQRGRGDSGSVSRHSGGWQGHRGRCSHRAASSWRGAICRAELAAISGRGFIEKSHLERGGSGAAAPGGAELGPHLWDPLPSQGFDAQGKCAVSPHSQPHRPSGQWGALALIQSQRNLVVLSSLPPLAGLFPAWRDAQLYHVVPKI